MNILRVIPTMGKGGAEDIMVNLCNSESLSHTVTLMIMRRVVEDEFNISRLNSNVKVVFLTPSSLRYLGFLSRLVNFYFYIFAIPHALYTYVRYRIYSYDFVHSNLTLASYYSIFWQLLSIASFNKGVSFIETYHTNWHLIGWFQRWVFKSSWKLKHAVVYEILESEKSNLIANGVAKERIYYIPFGVPAESVNEVNRANFLNKFKEQIESADIVLMTVSRLRLFEKKIDQMLLCLAELKKNKNLNFVFLLCGGGKDQEQIEEMISILGLQANVVLCGYVDDPASIMSVCDIYLCAMVGEDTGISGLQAAMNGKAVMGVQTLNNFDDPTVSIKSFSNPADMARHIVNLVNNGGLASYASNCSEYVANNFSSRSMCESYESMYSKLKSLA